MQITIQKHFEEARFKQLIVHFSKRVMHLPTVKIQALLSHYLDQVDDLFHLSHTQRTREMKKDVVKDQGLQNRTTRAFLVGMWMFSWLK